MEYVPLVTYFAIEDEAETKSEYFDGVIVPMPDFSVQHNRVTFDMKASIWMQLRKCACQGYGTPLRVYSAACNTVMYPDLTVVCDPPAWAKTRYATLLNPTLIVEVFSAATEARDRGEKFRCCRAIASLSTYVLIAEDKPLADVFTRQTGGAWLFQAFRGQDAVVPLPAVGCEMRLADVYDRVPFPPQHHDTKNADGSEQG